MIERKPCIYLIENLKNGKKYIGQTNRSFDERKRNHISKLRRGIHDNAYLQSAWNKYGEENFKFKIILSCGTEDLDILERKFINDYETLNRNKGYNLESGGSSSKTLSMETRNKIGKPVILTNTGERFPSASIAAKKYNLSQGSISSCCRGELKSAGKLPNGEYSVWVFEKDYNADANYFFHRHLGKHNPRSKSVICITTGEVFESTNLAAKAYGLNQSKISLVCNGKRNYTGKLSDGTKLKWSFYDECLSN